MHTEADAQGKKAMGCWAQANAEATLALVEQLRVMNLATVLTNASSMVANGTGDPDGFMPLYNKINPQIVKGLGL